MNAPLPPNVLPGHEPPLHDLSPSSPPDGQRHLWHSRFGAMLIEVKGGTVFVNGQAVVPHVAAGPADR